MRIIIIKRIKRKEHQHNDHNNNKKKNGEQKNEKHSPTQKKKPRKILSGQSREEDHWSQVCWKLRVCMVKERAARLSSLSESYPGRPALLTRTHS